MPKPHSAPPEPDSMASAVASLLGMPPAPAAPVPPAAPESPDGLCPKRDLSPEFRAHVFRKGQSGNPSGNRRLDPDLKAMLVAGSHEAARALCDIVTDPSIHPKVRCQAAALILDRVYGRAVQPIDAALGGSGEPVRFEFVGILDEWAK